MGVSGEAPSSQHCPLNSPSLSTLSASLSLPHTTSLPSPHWIRPMCTAVCVIRIQCQRQQWGAAMVVANGSSRRFRTKGSDATHLGRCGSAAKGLRSCSNGRSAAVGPGGADPPLEALRAADPPSLDLGGDGQPSQATGAAMTMSMPLGTMDLPLPASERVYLPLEATGVVVFLAIKLCGLL